jgi:hypothetical protein
MTPWWILLVAHAVLCVTAFRADPAAGWVLVCLGVAGVAAAAYLVVANRRLMRG